MELEPAMTSAITGTRSHLPAPPVPGRAFDARARRSRIAFCLLTFVFTTTMLGTTLPTPLYVIYQARCHFSPDQFFAEPLPFLGS